MITFSGLRQSVNWMNLQWIEKFANFQVISFQFSSYKFPNFQVISMIDGSGLIFGVLGASGGEFNFQPNVKF